MSGLALAPSAAKFTMNEITLNVLDRSVSQLTISDLEQLFRKVIQSTLPSYYLDEEGYLVFRQEQDYQAYLEQFPKCFPSEIRAYYINPQGFKVCYSDYEFTPEYEQELERIREEPVVSAEEMWKELGWLGNKD